MPDKNVIQRNLDAEVSDVETKVDTLIARLTAARAGYLDELAAANLPADIDTLLARLTAARAGYLDELDFDLNARLGTPAGASVSADLLTIDNLVDELESRLTAARAGYLDELAAANIPADIDTLITRLTAARAGYLDELAAANLPADVDTLISRVPDTISLANINAQVDTALTDVNLNDLIQIAGSVNDVTPAAGNFDGDTGLSGNNDFYNGMSLVFTSGTLAGLTRRINDYTGASKNIVLDNAFPSAPANGDTFSITSIEILAMRGTDNAATAAALTTHDAKLDVVDGYTDPKVAGRRQVLEVNVTSAANVGDVTLATVTTQPCVIESVIIHADTASQTDLTSASIYGGAAKVITFINITDGAKANIDAVDEQVWWEGYVRLATGKTVVMTLAGTGATAVDLTVTITYYACTDGGYLA